MIDFTTALERELHRLEGELEQDPRTRRIKQIRQLLADYQAGTANGARPAAPPAGTPSRPRAAALTRRHRRVRVSKSASVRRAVHRLLTAHGTVHRRDILQNLIEQQLMGHEKS